MQGDGGDKAGQAEGAGPALEAMLKRLELATAARPQARRKWTVREVYQATVAATIWVVPELLPGGLATLAGRPKVGKSLLALGLAAAVASGGRFLGREVTAGPVLYLALEDSLPRLQERMRRLKVAESAPLAIYTEWSRLDELDGLRELLDTVAETRPRLVVIDTLSRTLGVGRAVRGEMASAVLTSLQQIAFKLNCCVLTIDHHRKGGPGRDAVNDLLGPTSKAASLDTVWGLYDGRVPGEVLLRVTGREVMPRELALGFDAAGGTWEVKPEPAPRATEVTEVLRALAELGGQATTAELGAALGMPAGSVSRALRRLVRLGRVRRGERVGHRVPYELVEPQAAARDDEMMG